MPKRSHDELGIVHELFKLALFLLGDMSGRRIVSVLNDISVSFDSQIAEFVFKIAYLGRTKGVVGGGEYYGFRPVVLIGISLMLHKSIENALAVLPDASLSYVSDVLSGIIGNAKKEIHTAPFQIFTVLTFFYFCARYLICNACPVGKCAFDTSACISVHKKEIYVFSSGYSDLISPYRLMNFQLL